MDELRAVGKRGYPVDVRIRARARRRRALRLRPLEAALARAAVRLRAAVRGAGGRRGACPDCAERGLSRRTPGGRAGA